MQAVQCALISKNRLDIMSETSLMMRDLSKRQTKALMFKCSPISLNIISMDFPLERMVTGHALIGRMGPVCNMIRRPTSTCDNRIIPASPSSDYLTIHTHNGHNWKSNMLICHCSFMVSIRVFSEFARNIFSQSSH